uniref:NADH dehydrogenase [ubiquinone] 1 beta subcomplex subunit 7 n=1 Tax=Myotis myotis TaxID=51298 RepID=A0A7J7R9P8_MYOMY|nr:NADH:ubiquinone oxidoreductase subunit B7 [Myotis myotis]
MGEHLARHYLGDSSGEPDPLRMPTFPPDYGFPGRKEREMVATQQQMNDAQLVLQQRDSFPNFLACKHEQHDWDYCEHLDYVKRMKEFERERRLLQRKKRREQREADLARSQGSSQVAV